MGQSGVQQVGRCILPRGISGYCRGCTGTLQKPRVTLRDYIQQKTDPNICQGEPGGQRVTVPVYRHLDQGPAGEPCLLGAAIRADGSRVEGAGYRELVVAEGGVVRLIRAERVL